MVYGKRKQMTINYAGWSRRLGSWALALLLITVLPQVVAANPEPDRVLSTETLPDECIARVIVASAPLRAGPGEGYDEMEAVHRDVEINLLDRSPDGEWFNVQVPGIPDARERWVLATHVAINRGCIPPHERDADAPAFETSPGEAAPSAILSETAKVSSTITPTIATEPTIGLIPDEESGPISATMTISRTPDSRLALRALLGHVGEKNALYLTIVLIPLVGFGVFFLTHRRKPSSASPATIQTALLGKAEPVVPQVSASEELLSVSQIGGTSAPPTVGVGYLETRLPTTNAMRYYPLTQPKTSIGRDGGNTIVIDTNFTDPDSVSRHHAEIVRVGNDFVVKDLASANGLYVNQRRSHENVLRDGAVLTIGTVQFTFRLNRPGSRS